MWKLTKKALRQNGKILLSDEYISNGHWMIKTQDLSCELKHHFKSLYSADEYLNTKSRKLTVVDSIVEPTFSNIFDVTSQSIPARRWNKTEITFTGKEHGDVIDLFVESDERYVSRTTKSGSQNAPREFLGLKHEYVKTFGIHTVYGEGRYTSLCSIIRSAPIVIMPCLVEQTIRDLKNWFPSSRDPVIAIAMVETSRDIFDTCERRLDFYDPGHYNDKNMN